MDRDRNIVLVGGIPGSGKSRLCRSVVSEQYYEQSIDHVPVGEIIRTIGRGTLRSIYREEIQRHLNSPTPYTPIDREIMYNVMSEALTQHDDADLLLIDNYPRYIDQVEDMYELAMLDDRNVRGLILTDVSDKIAIARMLHRRPSDNRRAMTELEAMERIAYHKQTYPSTKNLLRDQGLPVEIINTFTFKADTTEHAIQTVNYMISPDNSHGRNAS